MEPNLKKSPKKQQLIHKPNSSIEDLSLEEKYILSSGKRQDPQGEEHSGSNPSHCKGVGNNRICNNKKSSRIPTNSSSIPKEGQPQAAMMKANRAAGKSSVNASTSTSSQTNCSNNNNNAALGSGMDRLDHHHRHEDRRISSSSSDDRDSDSSSSSGDDEDGKNRNLDRDRDHHYRNNNSGKGVKSKKSHGSASASSSTASAGGPGPPNPSGHSKSKNMSLDSTNSGHSAYNTLIIHQNNSSLLADTWLPANHEFTSIGMGSNTGKSDNESNPASFSKSRNSVSPSLLDSLSQHQAQFQSNNSNRSAQQQQPIHYNQMSPNLYENIEYQGNSGGATSSELSDIPRDYLDQLTVLKHLAKDLQQEPSGSNLKRSESFSRSQPDLTQQRQYNMYANQESSKPQPQQPWSSTNWQPNKQVAASGEEILPSVQILEILMRENSNLKAELVNARRKINTINKLEAELTHLQVSHAALFESAERRESLERSARVKLSSELKRLTAVNRELMTSSGSLQNLAPFTGNLPVDIEVFKKELSNKDSVITQLISQNKELVAIKERQEIELTAQRATLAEQRTHIEILDNALTNAQTNVIRLEEECRKKQEYVDKVSHLQRAMSSLQLSNDKREQSDKKIRSQLEGEISDLKSRITSLHGNGSGSSTGSVSRATQPSQNSRTFQSPPPYPGSQQALVASQEAIDASKTPGRTSNDVQLQQLQEKLKASEDQIYHLNSQVAKWENVFSAADFHPKHSQSAASTPNSWTHSPSRDGGGGAANFHFFGNDKTQSSEDLQNNFFRVSDLEWKIKDLESRLVEKDAVIRILQTGTSNVSSPVNRRSPVHFSSLNSSNSSSVPTMQYSNVTPGYRDSPSYSQASTVMPGYSPLHPGMSKHHSQEAGGSLGSIILDRRSPSVSGAAAAAMYAKMGLIQQQLKSESEPPSYANLPLKLRLGGSGSSLMKNSTESLQHVLGHSSAGSGNSPAGSISGPGSVSSTSGASATGHNNTEGKSIDDQLKELDTQLLSKGGPETLKMHSGLCCLPGFTNSTSRERKGKISKSLLESLSAPYNLVSGGGSCGGPKNPMSILGLNIMPPKPPSTYHTQNHGSSNSTNQTRTSSGPPFMSSASTSFAGITPCSVTTTTLLSNSVDSVLNESTTGGSRAKPTSTVVVGGNVFTPASPPKGLPPKSPSNPFDSTASAGKSRSLERNKTSTSSNTEPCTGKYTVIMYDAARCKSLDRKELKSSSSSSSSTSTKGTHSDGKKSEKESKGNLKSSVSSKAAFFGQLLTRRSPSPSREKKDKDLEKENKSSAQSSGVRFPFSGSSKNSSTTAGSGQSESSQNQKDNNTNGQSDADLDTMLLDRQGRSSQSSRNRISSKWSSSNTLESVEEISGSESPWTQRKSVENTNAEIKTNSCTTSDQQQHQQKDITTTNTSVTNANEATVSSSASSGNNKKWGRIVKTPFGLRYTFGSPRVATDSESGQGGPRK